MHIEMQHIPFVTYVVERDYFLAFKAPEFSVYNKSEKHLYYRIESNYDLKHNIKVVTYPSKQVVAKLRSKSQGENYAAKISIRNMSSNQWSHGEIIQSKQWFYTDYSMKWNGYNVSMINRIASLTTEIVDLSQGDRLARFHRRWFSRSYKYDLELYSERLPESIYLLGLAVACRGKNG
jgi:hypothetical protein